MTAIAAPAIAPVSATGVIHGEVITRRWVVEMILDLVDYSPARDLSALRIVEPSAGTGAFLSAILERLIASAFRHHSDPASALSPNTIHANELQPDNVRALREMVSDQLTGAGICAGRAHELAHQWVTQGDYLIATSTTDAATADFVVGNPPYIRMEDLGEARWKAYQAVAPTMRGRADVYIAFYEVGLRQLKTYGRLGYICADRWMRNNYGGSLRHHITTQGFSMDAVVTLHDASAFETDVDAYPAVTIISRGRQGSALVADSTNRFTAESSRELVSYARSTKTEPQVTQEFTAARLSDWHLPGKAGWPGGTPDSILWLRDLARRFPTIEMTGAKISIGVATGADAVYVTPRGGHVPMIESDRLLPLSHADDIRTGAWDWQQRHLVNPWLDDGVVDLADFPLLEGYLRGHPQVHLRNIARKNPATWHRTIDRVNLALLDRRLILLQDMSAEVKPVVAPAGFYPHHNLYWIDVTGTGWSPEALAGVLLADQVREQITAYCVLMRGRTLRLQAQYLRRVRVPNAADLSGRVVAGFEKAYEDADRSRASLLFADSCS